jgi:tRNA pseudouridine38-40 synthase
MLEPAAPVWAVETVEPADSAPCRFGLDEIEPRRGVLLRVAYVGTPFAGFAPQPGQRTVAGELLQAVQKLDPTIRVIRGASRTDAGVHALDHPVAFDTAGVVPLRGWLLGTRRWLDRAVAVREATTVPLGYNPRFDALEKTYRYRVRCGPTRDPFLVDRAWQLGPVSPHELAAVAGQELAAARGEHRFDAFRSARDERTNTTRRIEATSAALLDDPGDCPSGRTPSAHSAPARLAVAPGTSSLPGAGPEAGAVDGVVALEITGSAFLHNMVRILVGTAVDVARGRLGAGAVARALASGRRQDAGVTAPPCGLYLARVRLRSA